MSTYSPLRIRVTNFSGMGGEFGLNMKGPAGPLLPGVCVMAGIVAEVDATPGGSDGGSELPRPVASRGICASALGVVCVDPGYARDIASVNRYTDCCGHALGLVRSENALMPFSLHHGNA